MQLNLQYCCNSYWPTTPQGCCWDWLESIVIIIVLFHYCLLGFVLYLKMWKLSPSSSCFDWLSLFSLWWCPAALSFDRQVWECERTALEWDRHWPQTVSLFWGLTSTDNLKSGPTSAPISFIWKASFTLIGGGLEGLREGWQVKVLLRCRWGCLKFVFWGT